MTQTLSFNNGWAFRLDPACGLTPPDGGAWEAVTLPHDWLIRRVSALYEDGTGWYRKRFSLEKTAGLRYALYFEGVYQDCAVFVNGEFAREWKYGYSSFHADITPFLVPGENEVLVRVCVRHPNSRWYAGAGIIRDVWLWTYPETTHLLPHSLYISPHEEVSGRWRVHMEAETAGDPVPVRFRLLMPDGTPLSEQTAPEGETVPDAGDYAGNGREIRRFAADFTLDSPRLWDPSDPFRYRAEAALLADGAVIDRIDSFFGCRTIELRPDSGFWLNHRRFVLHGACLHHDLGCLGAAFYASAAGRQLRLLRGMGVNAVRTAHNMPAPALMECADRLGLLVMSEAFDCWRLGKTEYDYHRWFDDWHARDVASWVRRDRNHPSLVFWSIGNEIYDPHADAAKGRALTEELTGLVRRHDPGRNAAVTFASNYLGWENAQRSADCLDLVGYNYGEALYDAQHAAYPGRVIFGSETAALVQSRGIYHFPLSQPILADDDLQCSALGNSSTSFGARGIDQVLAADERYPYSAGQFLWSGFDYIGEPSPYHTKNAYFGQIDTAGFPKDSWYRYRAAWTDEPVLHLYPYWDFNDGQLIDVCAASNCEEVELWLNGVSQGRKRPGPACFAAWQVPYAPGVLRAVGYDAAGRELLCAEETSFGDAASLLIEADRASLRGDGRELLFCTVTAADREGRAVKNANNIVTAAVSGAGVLLGMDNGDSTDPDEYQTDRRALFSGKLLLVLAGRGEGGELDIEVRSPGLAPARLRVPVTPCADAAQRASVPPAPPERARIPVRKIALRAAARELGPACPACEVTAALFPADASPEPLTWRVTDEHGLTARTASLEILDDRRVRLRALGDGAVRLRCCCANGRAQPQLISVLEFDVSGLGERIPDPYEYLGAARYDHSGGEITSGNERGIATARGGESWAAWDRLDFGRAGSDTLTIDIFELTGEPMPLRFWRGVPHAAGSRMIGERIYHKKPVWNVYQPETFRLDEPLRGLETFGIELHGKVHIRGFRFLRDAWARVPAVAYDSIYGDSYTETPEAVTEIGNNVSLVFREFDFGERGTSGIAIRGRSALENNSIHLIFRGEDGAEERRIVEFAGAEDWTRRSFSFEPVVGKRELTFLFLPGSRFDFADFQFL